MMKQLWTRSLAIAAGVLLVGAGSAQAISIDYVPVGNAGNGGEASGFIGPIPTDVGAVAYDYSIGKYEVTVDQYTEFLNAKAGDPDLKGLYNAGMAISKAGAVYTALDGSKPINWVSWGDAARFANWVGNGGGAGDMESGAYALAGVTDAAGLAAVSRSGGSTFLASEYEWYKAAYHLNDGVTANFYDYGNSSNAVPVAEGPAGGANSANYNNAVGASVDVGSYVSSMSPYGAFDMSGNVEEWTDTTFLQNGVTPFYIHRGGAYNDSGFGIQANGGRTGATLRTEELVVRGIRLSSIGSSTTGPAVPEPSTWAMALVGLLGMGFVAYRRRAA